VFLSLEGPGDCIESGSTGPTATGGGEGGGRVEWARGFSNR